MGKMKKLLCSFLVSALFIAGCGGAPPEERAAETTEVQTSVETAQAPEIPSTGETEAAENDDGAGDEAIAAGLSLDPLGLLELGVKDMTYEEFEKTEICPGAQFEKTMWDADDGLIVYYTSTAEEWLAPAGIKEASVYFAEGEKADIWYTYDAPDADSIARVYARVSKELTRQYGAQYRKALLENLSSDITTKNDYTTEDVQNAVFDAQDSVSIIEAWKNGSEIISMYVDYAPHTQYPEEENCVTVLL